MTARALLVPLAALAFASSEAVAQTATVTGSISLMGRPVEGAVVYLVPESGTPPVDAGRATIDQRKLRFAPRILVVGEGAEVVFRNSDPLLHNIFSPHEEEPVDLGTYPEGESRSHRFERIGPHVILCNIHPEMEAWIYVAPTPWRAVSSESGTVRIEGVPPGDYRLHVWHRRASPLERPLAVEPGGTSAGTLDLGTGRGRAR